MVIVIISSTVDRGFEPQSGQSKDYKMDCLLMSTSKDWFTRSQDNMSEWSDKSTRESLFQ